MLLRGLKLLKVKVLNLSYISYDVEESGTKIKNFQEVQQMYKTKAKVKVNQKRGKNGGRQIMIGFGIIAADWPEIRHLCADWLEHIARVL